MLNAPAIVNRRRRWRWLATGAVVIVALYAARGPLLSGLGRWLDVGARPTAADCAVLLPGEPNTRPFVAAALYRAGLVRQIILPRHLRRAVDQEGLRLADDEVVTRVLRAREVALVVGSMSGPLVEVPTHIGQDHRAPAQPPPVEVHHGRDHVAHGRARPAAEGTEVTPSAA